MNTLYNIHNNPFAKCSAEANAETYFLRKNEYNKLDNLFRK